MQDKEFDQLFNSKLNHFEEEPSAMVWDNIANELDGKKERKRSILPYLSIAASVIVIAAASVLFLSRDVKQEEDEPVKIVKETKPSNSSTIQAVDSDNNTAIEDMGIAKVAVVNHVKRIKPQQNMPKGVEKVIETAPVTTGAQLLEKPEPLMAAAPTEKLLPSQPVVPAIDVPLNTRLVLAANAEPTDAGQPDIIAGSTSPKHVETKKRARGLGGLINTVIAAVDKREDKLIEFADSENDEGTKVAAVNLGIFKIKKQ